MNHTVHVNNCTIRFDCCFALSLPCDSYNSHLLPHNCPTLLYNACLNDFNSKGWNSFYHIYPLRQPANALNDDILSQLTCKMNDNKVPCIIALNLIQKRYILNSSFQCGKENDRGCFHVQVHCAKNGQTGIVKLNVYVLIH